MNGSIFADWFSSSRNPVSVRPIGQKEEVMYELF